MDLNRKTVLHIVLIIGLLAVSLERCLAQSSETEPIKDSFAEGVAPDLQPDSPELGLAAFRGDLSSLRRLISSGANIEGSGGYKRTPLILAASAKRSEAAKILIEAGANVNAKDVANATALHWAAIKGDEKIVALLLNHHAQLDVQNEVGQTPLICAAENGNKKIVEALLASGAGTTIRDEDFRSAEDWARRNGHGDIAALLTRPRKRGTENEVKSQH